MIALLCDVTPCSLNDRNLSFGVSFSLHPQNKRASRYVFTYTLKMEVTESFEPLVTVSASRHYVLKDGK
jgi:hypothetical protein